MSTRPHEVVAVYIDGASSGNPGPSGAGVVFLDGAGGITCQLSKPLGVATNNLAEYLALLYALEEARARGITRLLVKTDSELLAKQMAGAYRVREATLRLFHDLAKQMIRRFEQCDIQHVPRELNKQADRLARHASKTQIIADRR